MQQGKVSKDWARTAGLMSQRTILQRVFFASYPDIFSGKQNDVKKQTTNKQKKPWHGCKVQKRKKKRKERATRTKRKENKKKHK